MTEFITAEDIERLKARDKRWRDVDTALQVEQECRDSLTLNLIIEAINRRADEALEEMVDVDPTDAGKVASYQAEIKCARIIKEAIEDIMEKGRNAASTLKEEGYVELTGTEEDYDEGQRNTG